MKYYLSFDLQSKSEDNSKEVVQESMRKLDAGSCDWAPKVSTIVATALILVHIAAFVNKK